MNTSDHSIDDGPGQTPPSDDVRAGEYVLGVLDGPERRRVQARMASEPEFAARVIRWEERLAPWLLRFEAILPSPQAWAGICAQLGWTAPRSERRTLWNNVGFWRAATGVAIAASLALVVIGLGPARFAPGPTAPVAVTEVPADKPVTVLSQDDGKVGWLASIDAAKGQLLMLPVPSAADAQGRVAELWLIPPGQAPLSLGRVSHQKAQTVDVPAAYRPALAIGATLAVTLEPEQGIPHAAPSGPIVAKGGIEQI